MNKSGHRGVYLIKNSIIARIKVNKKIMHLGSFASVEKASEAYQKALLEVKDERLKRRQEIGKKLRGKKYAPRKREYAPRKREYAPRLNFNTINAKYAQKPVLSENYMCF